MAWHDTGTSEFLTQLLQVIGAFFKARARLEAQKPLIGAPQKSTLIGLRPSRGRNPVRFESGMRSSGGETATGEADPDLGFVATGSYQK
jgi:hypothetical protein